MPDWVLLIVSCSVGLFGALLFFLKTCIESSKQQELNDKFEEEFSEEFSHVLDSVTEFQRVAYDFPSNSDECETGQLFINDNEVFLRTDDSYVKLAMENSHSNLPTNCVNCGAPLHGHICKYCDTEYN